MGWRDDTRWISQHRQCLYPFYGIFRNQFVAGSPGHPRPGFLEQVTGLSHSHCRPGKVVTPRPSTLNRVHARTENFVRKRMAAKGWPPEEIDEWIAAGPSQTSAQPSPFQDLVHGLTTPAFNPYRETEALAAQIDNLDQFAIGQRVKLGGTKPLPECDSQI